MIDFINNIESLILFVIGLSALLIIFIIGLKGLLKKTKPYVFLQAKWIFFKAKNPKLVATISKIYYITLIIVAITLGLAMWASKLFNST